MTLIEYDSNEFKVVEEKHFKDIGEFRVIHYTTGYYAMQKKINSTLRWETIFISPLHDLKNEHLILRQGYMNLISLFSYFDLAETTINNELMNLTIKLPEGEEYTETILTEDGWKIADKIYECIRLSDKKYSDYLEHNLKINRILLAIAVIAFIYGLLYCSNII